MLIKLNKISTSTSEAIRINSVISGINPNIDLYSPFPSVFEINPSSSNEYVG